MLLVLPAILCIAGLAAQVPDTPTADTPAGAPLPNKKKYTPSAASSELEGDTKEAGTLSIGDYQGGSFGLKRGRTYTYVNASAVVLVQGKTRFAIPVSAISEVLLGNGVYPRVTKATANGVLFTGTKNQSPGNLTIVGLIWSDPEKKNGVVLRLEKSDFPNFVSAVQTVTGLTITNTDAK